MARADDDNGVEVVALNQQVDVGPDEDEPRAGTPMTWGGNGNCKSNLYEMKVNETYQEAWALCR